MNFGAKFSTCNMFMIDFLKIVPKNRYKIDMTTVTKGLVAITAVTKDPSR